MLKGHQSQNRTGIPDTLGYPSQNHGKSEPKREDRIRTFDGEERTYCSSDIRVGLNTAVHLLDINLKTIALQ